MHQAAIERRVLILASFLVLVFISMPFSKNRTHDDFSLVTMDMGNGTCHLIMTEQSSYLFDGGSLDKKSCGRNIILPVLENNGVRRLDGVFISHANRDHFSGLSEIVGRIPIGSFFVGESFYEKALLSPDGAPGRMLRLIESWRIPYAVVSAGSEIASSDLKITVHHPDKGIRYQRENDNSLVVSVGRTLEDDGQASVIFTGDIEEEGMCDILDEVEGLPKTIILEAPHHGSVRRSSENFIDTLSPDFLVQSTGKMRLRRDHLSEIMMRHEDIVRLNTSSHGLIRININDSPPLVEIETTLKNDMIQISDSLREKD